MKGLFGRWLKEPLPGILGSLTVGAGFVLSLLAFSALLARGGDSGTVTLWQYHRAGELELSLGFVIDNLSVVMMLIITGIDTLIHVYSLGYMHGDEGFSRYLAKLNLFVAAMLTLVMADSFLLMFIGWEGIGVCSYLLIGFWHRDKLNTDPARKAFTVNRIGDVGFLLGMFLTFQDFGTLSIAAVNDAAAGLASRRDDWTDAGQCSHPCGDDGHSRGLPDCKGRTALRRGRCTPAGSVFQQRRHPRCNLWLAAGSEWAAALRHLAPYLGDDRLLYVPLVLPNVCWRGTPQRGQGEPP